MTEYDLSQLAVHADRGRRWRVMMVNAQGVLGLSLVVIGTYFLLTPPAGTIPRYSSGPAILIAVGVVIFGVAVWVRSSLGPSPRRLVVSPDSITFEEIPRHPPYQLSWNRPGFRLEIRDFREIRRVDPNSRSHGYDFIIIPGNGPETAVPLDAVDYMVRIAEGRGLLISRRPVAIGAKAPMLVTTIRSTA